MRHSKKHFIYSLLAIIAVVACAYGFALGADAQGVNTVNTGLSFGAQTGLVNQDIRITIAKIIRIILGFLGIIAVGLTMYAGWLWMTAKGNEEKVDQAKNVLKNAVIGLAIILSSFAIVSFIISRLLLATTSGVLDPNGGGGAGSGGISGLGNGIIKSVYPAPFQGQDGVTDPVARNTSIIVTFREPMQAKSICVDVSGDKCASGSKLEKNSIKIFRSSVGDGSGNVTDVTVTSADNKTFIFKPAAPNYLGFQNEPVDYTVNLTRDVRKANGDRVFNLADFRWTFKVGTALDFNPPKIVDVVKGGIFPPPDNEGDAVSGSQPASAATGTITVNGAPSVNAPADAKITRTSPPNAALAAGVEGTNTCAAGTITFSIVNQGGLKARTAYSQPGLVAADLDIVNSRVSFAPCGISVVFTAAPTAGSAWRIAVEPATQADTLTIGSKIFSFVNGVPSGNQIKADASPEKTAENIAAAMVSHPEMTATVQNRVVTVKAKIAGNAGNSLELSASGTALAVARMSGGSDQTVTFSVRDKKDQPKNTVIQINFNEAINPLTISGTSVEMAEKLRVVNSDGEERSGAACTKDSDCLSYKCSGGSCQGDQLAGTFLVSNQYQTVEFISDIKCGVNGCGENIYCLPANSNLRVEAAAASLVTCRTAADCSAPFSACISNVCRDERNKKNSPVSSSLDGIVDVADNSLDGNRNDDPQGKAGVYNENKSALDNAGAGDNYRWSFWTNDKLDLTPPKITSTSVNNNQQRVPLAGKIKVIFSKLMFSASLSTGTVTVNNGVKDVVHKLINVWSLSNTPIGYWVQKEDGENPPPDGQPDYSIALIGHGIFGDSTAYKSQVGSGVKDIYQNCYKPSASLNCAATAAAPSCCRNAQGQLEPTSRPLTADGNCP